VTKLAVTGVLALQCQQVSAQPKDAEPATRVANQAFATSLPFSDRADFDDAKRGFIVTSRGVDISNMTIIKGDSGLIVIDTLLSNETAKEGERGVTSVR
jgi:alkyl sulfatase BDS1-like metallo-beta-lactamase superfamily hydrolase